MARYGIATLLEDHKVNYEFTSQNIPLHLTHVDSFEVDLSLEQLAAKLKQALNFKKEFKVRAIVDSFLGPNKDIPVTMLELTPELMDLHSTILGMVEAEGAALKNPHFHREGYGPHISIYGSRRILVGDEVYIKDVSIGIKIRDEPGAIHRIVATIPLGHEHEK